MWGVRFERDGTIPLDRYRERIKASGLSKGMLDTRSAALMLLGQESFDTREDAEAAREAHLCWLLHREKLLIEEEVTK